VARSSLLNQDEALAKGLDGRGGFSFEQQERLAVIKYPAAYAVFTDKLGHSLMPSLHSLLYDILYLKESSLSLSFLLFLLQFSYFITSLGIDFTLPLTSDIGRS